ncbi:MAG: efflux RND transporter permease subunit [Bacteroidaceae bacterium]|nr:efflux RND transporter permease subunit [Bacteroidaceae bacterium]
MDLGKWAFKNRGLIYFLVAVLMVGGAFSVYNMSKLEDPEVKVKLAMVVAVYPGASAHQVELEVTDVLEKNIRMMGDVDNVESYSYNDMAIMTVELRSTLGNNEVEQCWDRLRRKVTDSQSSLPSGVSVMVKDDFSNVYGIFYALTGDGLSNRELSDYAELVKREAFSIEGVDRVELYGKQKECIEIRLLQDKMASMGVMPAEVLATLNGQNSTSYAGYYDNGDQRVRVAVSDKFQTVDDISRMLVQGHEHDQLRLSDIAEVEKSIETPVRNALYYDNAPAIGVMVACSSSADITKVGRAVENRIKELEETRFPVGVECHKVFYQPDRVNEALGAFAINLVESVLIVVVLLMFFMGIKSGLIIGASLVVIVMGSILFLGANGGTMQRVSLASFILAMGMLVDNAIVIVDGILIDLKAGKSRMEAMCDIGKRTAMPLLGATLIAILSFLPIFLSPDTAGIYVHDLFVVLAVSLLLSWVLALAHVPLMSNRLFKPGSKEVKQAEGETDLYKGKTYSALRKILEFCLGHRISMVVAMVALCVVAVLGYPHMRQGFFPDMEYDQCYMEYKLPEGTNYTRVKRDLDSIQAYLRTRPEVKHITCSTGGTPARYNLVRTIATPSLAYGELIIDFESAKDLRENMDEIQEYLTTHYPDAYCKLKLYNLMFKKYPIELQLEGPDPAVLHALTDSVMDIMRQSGKVRLITTDWEPQVPVLNVDYDQASARAIGISRKELSVSLITAGGGLPVGSFHEGIYNNNLYVKCVDEEGNPVENLEDLQVFSMTPNLNGLLTAENMLRLKTGTLGREELINSVIGTTPLRQVSRDIKVEWEDPVVPRFNGQRMQRVQCSPVVGAETEKTRAAIAKEIEKIQLPAGYKMSWKGEKAASDRSMKYLFANFPLAIILMIGLLILLFKDYRKPTIIFCTIPMVFVGVILTMLLTGKQFTFVAIVGALGLIGMIIKNGIVLIDEINLELSQGVRPYDALINSSMSRLRPVMMASMTTVLGMIPLLTDAMFGSLAVTIMGGLLFGTVITLLVIPVLYAMFFKVKKG